MRLFDLFGRSRSRRAPRPWSNRVRCAVELLESRLVLSSTDPVMTYPPPTDTTTALTSPVMTYPPPSNTTTAPTDPVMTYPPPGGTTTAPTSPVMTSPPGTWSTAPNTLS